MTDFNLIVITLQIPIGPASNVERVQLMNRLGIPITSKYCLILGRLFKLHPEFDYTIRSILEDNPSAFVVFIYDKTFSWNLILLNRLKTSLGKFVSRIKFGAYSSYDKLIIHATVVLDTFPYGGIMFLYVSLRKINAFLIFLGCLTSHEALSNGIPMVTLPPEFIRCIISCEVLCEVDLPMQLEFFVLLGGDFL